MSLDEMKKRARHMLEGHGCPYCGNDLEEDISTDDFEVLGTSASRISHCHACDGEWEDRYTLKSVHAL